MTRKFVTLFLVGFVLAGCSSEKKTDAKTDQTGDSSVVAFDLAQVQKEARTKEFKLIKKARNVRV